MKSLNALHAEVNSPKILAIALESDQVAMEGFVDSLKAKWTAFKESVKPTDHEALVQKLALIPKLKADAAKIKGIISNAGEADMGDAMKKMNKLAAKLPVIANTPMQVIVELEKHRRALEVIGRKAQQATTPEKIKEIRISFQKLKTKESRINGNMVWTKAEMLKFIDELQRYFDTTTAMGKLYLESYTKAKRENPNLGMESLSEQIALEQLDDITSIAMEGFFTQFSGLMLIFASLLVYLAGVLIMVQGIILIFTGQFVPGILAFFGGGYVRDLGSRMLSTGDQMVNQDSYETANPYHR